MDAMYLAAKAETDIHRFAVDFKLVDRKYMAEREKHIRKGKPGSFPEPEIYNIAATAAFKMDLRKGLNTQPEVKLVWRFNVKGP